MRGCKVFGARAVQDNSMRACIGPTPDSNVMLESKLACAGK